MQGIKLLRLVQECLRRDPSEEESEDAASAAGILYEPAEVSSRRGAALSLAATHATVVPAATVGCIAYCFPPLALRRVCGVPTL